MHALFLFLSLFLFLFLSFSFSVSPSLSHNISNARVTHVDKLGQHLELALDVLPLGNLGLHLLGAAGEPFRGPVQQVQKIVGLSGV